MPGMPSADPAPDIPTPALLRASRGAYSIGIRRELAKAGIDDLPPNGAYVIGGMGNRGATATDLIRQLGMSERSTSELVDTLVSRGFLTQADVAADQREIAVVLTKRGLVAAEAIGRGVDSVEDELRTFLTAADYQGLRRGLVGLCELRERWETYGS